MEKLKAENFFYQETEQVIDRVIIRNFLHKGKEIQQGGLSSRRYEFNKNLVYKGSEIIESLSDHIKQ